MKLTPRLSTIADMIPRGSNVGDVGSDHGFLVIYLIESKICDFCIASDLNEGPAENAKKNIKKYGLNKYIDVRVGSGLVPYEKNEINVAVIAGMGGVLISDILLNDIELARSLDLLILQPMIGQKELRVWLYENNFDIIDEKIAIEGEKIYEIIAVSNGKMKIENDFLYEFGPKLVNDKSYEAKAFFLAKYHKYMKIKKSLDENSKNVDDFYYYKIVEKLEFLKELIL